MFYFFPTQSNGKLDIQGYTNIENLELSFFITNKDENSFPKFHEINMVNAAIKNGISKELVLDWQNQLNIPEKEGRFAFTAISIVTSAFSV